MSGKDDEYLENIRSEPCIVCFHSGTVPHHYRTPYNAGGAKKPDDRYALPLCVVCHGDAHMMGDKDFFEMYHINPFEEMLKLVIKYKIKVE